MTAAVWIFDRDVRVMRTFCERTAALWSMLYASDEATCSDGQERSLAEAHTAVEVTLVERRRYSRTTTATDLPQPPRFGSAQSSTEAAS